MGRESIKEPNPIVMQSSIALLQERFRRLQRMREKRQERELLRKLEEPNKQYLAYELPSGSGTGLLFFHFLPPRSRSPPRRQAANISLWSGAESKCLASSSFGLGSMEAPLFASLLTTVTDAPSSKKFQDTDCDDDVDTSLHL